MRTVQKKIIQAVHGFAKVRVPAKYTILNVGATLSQGGIPVFVELDNTDQLEVFMNLFVAMTNKQVPDGDKSFLGTCEIDSMASAHVYILSDSLGW